MPEADREARAARRRGRSAGSVLTRTAPSRARRGVAWIGIFSVLFQAILFGWHHHDIPFSASRVPAAAYAANAADPVAPDTDEDHCGICIALHHCSGAPITFVGLVLPEPARTPSPGTETHRLALDYYRAFQSRAPPRA
jgi:hypothetical protein